MGKNAKRRKEKVKDAMTGKIIKPNQEAILVENIVLYARKLGYIISSHKFMLMVLFMLIMGGGVVSASDRMCEGEVVMSVGIYEDMCTLGVHESISNSEMNVKRDVWIDLDGTGDIIDYGDQSSYSPANFENGDFSGCVWFRVAENTSTRRYMIGKGAGGNYEYALTHETSGRGNFYLYTAAGGTVANVAGEETFIPGQWYHRCWTSDNGTILSIIHDGMYSSGDLTYSGSPTDGTAKLYGGYRGAGYFNGSLDDFRLYNKSIGIAAANKIHMENVKTKYNNFVPVIMLHRYVGNEQSNREYKINYTQLVNILDVLNESNYTTITDYQLKNWTVDGVELPERPIMITWDDSSVTEWVEAAGVMEEYGYVSVISLTTGWNFTTGQEWENVTRLVDEYGWGVASHSDEHCHMGSETGGSAPTWCNETVSRRGNLSAAYQAILSNTSRVPVMHVFPWNDDGVDDNERLDVISDCMLNYTICFNSARSASEYYASDFVYINANSSLGEFYRIEVDNETTREELSYILNYSHGIDGLVFESAMDENRNSTLYDRKGNNFTGDISGGGATWDDDGVNVTLVEGVDYNVLIGDLELVNESYSHSNIIYSNYIVNGTLRYETLIEVFEIEYNNFYAMIFLVLFIFAALMFMYRMYVFSGLIIIMLGFSLLYSEFNILISFTIIVGGVLTLFVGK